MNAVLKTNPIADMVEEFVTLHNRLAPELDRYEALKKELGKLANLDKTNRTMALEGYEHVIDYTAPTATLVCNVGIEEFIGTTGAWDALTVSITAARKVLPEAQVLQLFDLKQGSRRFRRIR